MASSIPNVLNVLDYHDLCRKCDTTYSECHEDGLSFLDKNKYGTEKSNSNYKRTWKKLFHFITTLTPSNHDKM
jgi:hypothetical protein